MAAYVMHIKEATPSFNLIIFEKRTRYLCVVRSFLKLVEGTEKTQRAFLASSFSEREPSNTVDLPSCGGFLMLVSRCQALFQEDGQLRFQSVPCRT